VGAATDDAAKNRGIDFWGDGIGCVLTSRVASLDDNDLLHLSVLVTENDPATTAIRKLKAGALSDEEGDGHSKQRRVKQRLGLECAPSEVTVAISDVCNDLLDLIDVIPHDFDHV